MHACNNRCPHEGYPLVEGVLDAQCVLTCNWHNWKFDLKTGETLYGGDRLRVYPVMVREGMVHVDVADGAAVSAMTADQLRPYRVIALLSTRNVERRSWDTIAAHVNAGAGLFVAAGADVDPSVVASLTTWQPAVNIVEEQVPQLTTTVLMSR